MSEITLPHKSGQKQRNLGKRNQIGISYYFLLVAVNRFRLKNCKWVFRPAGVLPIVYFLENQGWL
jgi:hypothetical protein